MKLSLFIQFVLLTTHAFSQDIVYIQDPDFKEALIGVGVDTNQDGEIQNSEAETVDSLCLRQYKFRYTVGLTSFINLKKIEIANNILLRSVDLSNLQLLETIYLSNNRFLKSIDLLNNSAVKVMEVGNNDSLRTLNLEHLFNVESLLIYDNHSSMQVELSHLTKMRELRLIYHDFEAIEPSNFPLLEWLHLSGYNEQISLDLRSNINLVKLHVSSCTSLENIQFDGLSNLQSITFSGINRIQDLDFKEYQNLSELKLISNDSLKTIQLDGLVQLTDLFVHNNDLLTELNLSDQINLEDFTKIEYNDGLKRLFIKNGKHDRLDLKRNPNLEIICLDEVERFFIQSKLFPDNIPFDIISSYCPYTSEGNPNLLTGRVKYDFDNNGCDDDDLVFSYPKFHIYNSLEEGFSYGNKNGMFSTLLSEGTNFIVPEIDQALSHFIFSPDTLVLTFPDSIAPFQQDFCITADGEYNDLDVVIIPQNQARPGFEAIYKVVIKNVGNTALPFDLTFGFQPNFMDYVSSNVEPVNVEYNVLTWQFEEFLPFEEKMIELVFELNTPTETPPLINGDVLNFFASVEIAQVDEQPSNNTHHLNQIVVNSFDPNDKTCLEGNAISPDMVGDYVHYMIRFENTGSADAVNIVVKDEIDTSSFEINTMQIIDASHDLDTRLTNGNIVEFIFKNIYLPSEDPTNKGDVTFRIKTKEDLTLGEDISNTAEIYFDFNHPIITNTTKTTIQTVFADNDWDGFTSDIDCNDEDPLINPNSDEVCDNIDNNCDGTIDEGLEFTTYYIDSDNDGYGDELTATDYCNEQSELVTLSGDCNDNDPLVNPNSDEVCDNIDNNCDGTIDEGLEFTTYYIDNDNDGYGDELTATDYCNEQSELVTLSGDCNDKNSDIYPGAEEIPNNNIDEDCNGTDLITGIHELLNSKIKIFPNPVYDILYIDVVGQLNYKCSLYDLTGKIILTSKNQKSIPLDSILEGTYLLELKDLKTGQKIIERIVIIK